MKIVYLLLIVACISSCTSTIYVVRHAEKAATPGSDPDLSSAGEQRALALRDTLSSITLTNIYATQFVRTLQTAQPTAAAQNIAVYRYNAASSDSLIEALSLKKNKKTLLVGHSNTVPAMLKKIGLNPSMQQIPENDFDNFFVVKISWFWGRSIRLTEKTYGAVSP
ncbi:MAG: phosphoglycerate mutase family protein [Bacteroidota bacterium]